MLVFTSLRDTGLDRLPVDDGVKLLAHFAGPSLRFDVLIAVDDAPTVGKRAEAVSLFHRTGAVVLGVGHDLDGAHPSLCAHDMRDQPHARALCV